MRYSNEPVGTTEPSSTPKRNRRWLWVFLITGIIVVILLFALSQKKKKPAPVGKRQAIAATPPKPKRIFPWYVYNKIIHKWAVIDSCEPDGGKDTLWFFYGSESRYENQLNRQIGGSKNFYGGYFSYSYVEDTTAAAPLGGEFQFSTLDSAKRMYKKYVVKVKRERFITDSIKKRDDFIADSIFKRYHTYTQLENK